MKILKIMLVMLMFLCSAKLIAQDDSDNTRDKGNTNYIHPTDSTSSNPDNTKTYQQQAPGSGTMMMDANFIRQAASGSMMEVQLGRLAEEKASSESVKQFARLMERDHTKAGTELKKLASMNNITIDSKLSGENKRKIDQLSSLSGAEFDKQYMTAMIQDHNQDIEEFQDASSAVQNAELKSWINKTLPTLKSHLNAAQKTQDALNGTGNNDNKNNNYNK